jgi:hypothetical protein
MRLDNHYPQIQTTTMHFTLPNCLCSQNNVFVVERSVIQRLYQWVVLDNQYCACLRHHRIYPHLAEQ